MSSVIVNGQGPSGAKVMIVGECPSVSDLKSGIPFSGGMGEELTRMLHEAGFVRAECYLTFLVKEKVPGGNMDYLFARNKTEAKAAGISEVMGKFPRPQILSATAALLREIESVNPNIVITLGEAPLWALTGNSGITKWRGSILPAAAVTPARCPLPKILPTYSPAKIQVKWDWRFIAVQDLRRALRESAFPELRVPAYDFVVRPSFAVAMGWLDGVLERATTPSHVRSPETSPATNTHGTGQSNAAPPSPQSGRIRLACDIETRCGHIACIGFADSPTRAICIPLMDINRPDGYWPIEEEIALVLKIREVMTHPNVEIVGQNFLYDAQYLAKHWGFVGNVTHDTMIEHHVAFAGLEKGLHFLSAMYCDFHQYWKDEGKTWDPRYVDEEQLWVYNCKDCVNTFEVSYAIEDTIAALGLEGPRARQMRLFFPTLRMMLRGVRIDRSLRDKMGLELMEASAVRQQWLIDVAGDLPAKPKSKTAKPWYNSPKQLAALLYETLHLPVQKNRKTGAVTTDDEALDRLRKREPAIRPFLDTISELRSIGVFWNTFVKAPLDHDGRMRCSYNIAGTETYRYSSSSDAFGFGTNLQNLPQGNED